MVMFEMSSDVMKAARLPLIVALLFVVSCAPKKPVYDLGPRRAPQDNQSVMRGLSEKQETAPSPLIPGYNIPAPRMIDAPESQFQPQSMAIPPANGMVAMANGPVADGRRRPIKQFSGNLPTIMPIVQAPAYPSVMEPMQPMPHRNVGAPPMPTASYHPAEDTSFFGRVKSVFKKKEQPEPKRAPGGQGHLESGPSGPAMDNRGFSVEEGAHHLDSELKTLPQTKAERAANLSTTPEKVQNGKALTPSRAKKKIPLQPKPPVKQEKNASTSTKKSGPVPGWENPDNAPSVPETKAMPAPMAPPIVPPVPNVNGEKTFHEQVEERWKEQQETPPLPPGSAPSLQGKKLKDEELKVIPKEEPVSQADPSSNGAEVLMEFDISDEGDLVSIPDIAPTAGGNADEMPTKPSIEPKRKH